MQLTPNFLNNSNLRPLKIVVSSEKGAAGLTFYAIASELTRMCSPLEFAAGQPVRRFFSHKVEQHPDARVTGHLLHSGDEICKWAWVHFHGLACLKVLQRRHFSNVVAPRAQASYECLWHGLGAFGKADHAGICHRLSWSVSKGLASDHMPQTYIPRTVALSLA